ncbi:hypothetical protein ACKFKF_32660 [Phormidesmis sp. 146-12]
MINFAGLDQVLPDETMTWRGFGEPVMLNLNRLTGDALTPESSVIEAMGKLLNSLHQLQTQLNEQRQQADQPLLTSFSKVVTVNANGNPIVKLGIELEIDLEASLNNLVQ